jgi:hypothetical protein
MLQFDCFPVTDQLQIFRHLLTDLRTFRLEAKGQMRALAKESRAVASPPRAAKHLQDSDQQLLRLSRVRPGTLCRLRRGGARYPDRSRFAAKDDRLADRTRAQVIEVDTDGIYFRAAIIFADSFVEAGVSPAKGRGNAADTAATTTEIDQLRQGLAKELPPGIEVEFDEQFDAMFSYKAKELRAAHSQRRRHYQGRRAEIPRPGEIPARFPGGNDQADHARETGKIAELRDQFEKRIRNGECPSKC